MKKFLVGFLGFLCCCSMQGMRRRDSSFHGDPSIVIPPKTKPSESQSQAYYNGTLFIRTFIQKYKKILQDAINATKNRKLRSKKALQGLEARVQKILNDLIKVLNQSEMSNFMGTGTGHTKSPQYWAEFFNAVAKELIRDSGSQEYENFLRRKTKVFKSFFEKLLKLNSELQQLKYRTIVVPFISEKDNSSDISSDFSIKSVHSQSSGRPSFDITSPQERVLPHSTVLYNFQDDDASSTPSLDSLERIFRDDV